MSNAIKAYQGRDVKTKRNRIDGPDSTPAHGLRDSAPIASFGYPPVACTYVHHVFSYSVSIHAAADPIERKKRAVPMESED